MKKVQSLLTISVFILFAVFGCANSSQTQKPGFKSIQQEEVSKIIETEKAVFIDVRTPGEVAEGYIKGTNLFIDINGSDFSSQIEKLDKSKAYIVYCRSGARSSSASSYMIEHGFTKVYNLLGGFSNWNGESVKP